jgi:large subunit ribosomal protein L24
MKPTKMRNQLIYRASKTLRSKQISSQLSKELKKKYSKNSIRIVEGDNVKIMRGEFKGVDGKVSKISIENNSIAVEGVKKEKTKGDKFDVYIHPSNVVVTGLNSDDKWRIDRLEGKKPQSKPKESTSNEEKKQTSKPKETKVENNEKKEDKE